MNAEQTKFVLKSFPNRFSIMLIAKHGVGKSSVVKQVADELGIQFHDVRLSQSEVGDIKGLPFLNTKERITEFLKAYWWPRDPNSKGILFFDELNRATKDVLQAVFEICLDRRLDGEPLPEGWRVVAAINGSDDYDVIELDPALFDRWFIVDFEPTSQEWVSWARKNDVHDSIVEYISLNGEHLDPPVGQLEAGRIYPSRRSWKAFNDTCEALKLFDHPDDSLLTQICKGWLGREICTTFPRFLMNEFSRLRAADVLDALEKVKEKIDRACADIEVIASLANSVLEEAKKRKGKAIGEKQQENLRKFFHMLPKDVASRFWTDLLKDANTKKIGLSWQSDEDKDFLGQIFCR